MSDREKEGIFDHRRRSLTLGAILSVALVAFEALALTTVSPSIAEDFGGVELYGWIFSAFLLFQLVGTVVAGRQADRQGPARPFLIALVLVGAGLITASLASTMMVLILGRALQGLGGGALITCVYATVNVGYPDHLRPRILAAINSSYILPALAGPVAAGFVAETFTWRIIFLAFLPMLVVLGLFVLPAFDRLSTVQDDATQPRDEYMRLPKAVLLAGSTGLMLAGLKWVTGENPTSSGPETEFPLAALILAGMGALVAFFTLRQLLPEGTLVAKRGLPAAIASRGLFNATFFYTEAYMVLALNALSGYSATTAGMAVSAGALSGTAGMWVQERLDRRRGGHGRRQRVLIGWLLMAIGIVTISVPILIGRDLALTVAIAGWVTASLGMGIAHLTNAAIAFACSPDDRGGTVSSYLLLADLFGTATSIGVGGSLVAFGIILSGHLQQGLALTFGFAFMLVTLCFIASYNLSKDAKSKI